MSDIRAPLEPPDFRAIFASAIGLYLVLDPQFRMVAVADAYLRAALLHRDEVLGRDIFEAFPDDPDDPGATGTTNLRASLEGVYRDRVSDTMAVQKYDVVRPESQGGGSAVAAAVRVEPGADPVPLYVTADPKRLHQILLNLLTNAIRYHHPGGTVFLAVVPRPHGRLGITVTDTGRGIRPELVGRLFVAFERLDAAQAGFAGTGPGLALSRGLAEAMAGRLDVHSIPGEGSTFEVNLPACAAPAARVEEPGGDHRPVVSRAYRRPQRVLYIEDIDEYLRLVRRVLSRRPSISLTAAMFGGVGVDLALEQPPDLILLDLHLPDIAGEQVFRRLRAQRRTRNVPVVVPSADATQRHIDELLADGVTAHLTKPIDQRRLLAALDDTLEPAVGTMRNAGAPAGD